MTTRFKIFSIYVRLSQLHTQTEKFNLLALDMDKPKRRINNNNKYE